jgi:hydroxymethylpyrimidine/phosphomethylpyrimidine kinase
MKATAILATTWPPATEVTVRSYPTPKPAHPITRSAGDIELAIANLAETAKVHAFKIGRLPEQDVVADAFRAEHGQLAALICDPVQVALNTALNTLIAHARSVMPPDQFAKMTDRLLAHIGKTSRYAADLRPRH